MAINESTQEIIHYSEDAGAAEQMKKGLLGENKAPPVNCGVYLFSARVFEEFGLSSRSTTAAFDAAMSGN